ncbi:MAG: tetratricopeptide repeat protein [Verrucomicrobiaceae bacterium]|nr:tetratricopeptide repeat protein [Verrucomicrobiaceae bacterium]
MTRLIVPVAVAVLCTPTFVRGQAPAAPAPIPEGVSLEVDVQKAYEAGFALLQEGKFKEALEKVNFIKSKVNKPFPHVTFLEGACHFNLNDHQNAAAAFELYLKEFKDGENANAVKLGLGRAYLKLNRADEGVKMMKEAAADPALKGEAGLLLAEHYKKANTPDEAIKILESIIGDGVRSPEQIQAALMAADLYVAKGDTEKAATMLESVKGGGGTSGENAIQMNNLSFKLGDKMMEEKRYREALGSYQAVRRKAEVVNMMKNRIAKTQSMIDSKQGDKEQLEAKIAGDKAMLDEIEKRTDYDATLYYRLGRCYFEMQRPWEAILAFSALVDEFKDFPQRDKAMYGLIFANATLKRITVAKEMCEKFISSFPESTELGQITELYVMLSYQAGDLDGAIASADRAMGFPKADKERMLYLKGNVLFEKQRFQDAVTTFEILKKDFPQSITMDEVTYRIALAYFYQNEYKSVKKALEDYIEDHPKGQFIIDAKYRLAFIRFQGGEWQEAMEDLQKLIEESPNDPNIAQVYVLLGDGLKRKAETEPDKASEHYKNALTAYENAYKKSQGEDVRKYVMDNLTDLYSAEQKWDDLEKLWRGYLDLVKDKDIDASLKAIFHIVNATRKKGNTEEAVKLIAENVKPALGNASMEQVEVLIQQMCALMAPKKRRTSSFSATAKPADGSAKPADGATPAAPVKKEEPMPTFEELEKKIEELLKPEVLTPVANNRIMFARAWLARSMKETEKSDRIFNIIIEVARPEDLSPMMLYIVGDNARKKKDNDKAAACYQRLLTIFPNSEFADSAPVGLGEIAFEKGEFDKALELFTEATSEKYQGSSRLLDATLGKAKTMVKLNKLEDAKKEYNQIAVTKEWRVAWAEALYMLGQIEELKKEYANAITFYVRVYVAHQKYKDWMSKAYLQNARCLVLLGGEENKKKAVATLEEFLRRQDVRDQPEYKLGQEEIRKLGGVVPP